MDAGEGWPVMAAGPGGDVTAAGGAVSAMAGDIPEIAGFDLDPVFVRQHGAVAAGVRVRLTG